MDKENIRTTSSWIVRNATYNKLVGQGNKKETNTIRKHNTQEKPLKDTALQGPGKR